jgi:hypothetical protein
MRRFMSFINIATSFGSLFQCVAAINNRFYLSRVDQFLECMPAFPLSHACIVTDKFQQIPFWVGEVQRANMQPLVYGRIHF